jgi:membrane protein implicated in regulation of membrane protease activity
VLQATVAIMMSGILIVVAELITGGAFSLMIGLDRFNAIMDSAEGPVVRAIYGIPMNILFVGISLLVYYIFRRRRMKAAETAAVTEDAQ